MPSGQQGTSCDRPPRDLSPELALTWLGHASVRIDLGGVSVLTDPLLVDSIGPIRRVAPPPPPRTWAGVDAALISHLHRDHLDLRSLRLLAPGTPLVVPAGAGQFLHRAGFRVLAELAAGESVAVGPHSITATPAAHSGFRPPFGPRAAAVGYVIRGRHSIYFAGDTGLFPGMADLAAEDLDVSLLPVGGWGPTLRGGHLHPATAVQALRLIRPRIAVPIHWGTFWPRGLGRVARRRFSEPGPAFAARAAGAVPEIEVLSLQPGQRAVLVPPRQRPGDDV